MTLCNTPPSLRHAAATFLAIVCVIAVGVFYWHTHLQSVLLLCLIIAGCSAYPLSSEGFVSIRQAMSASITRALPAVYIFLLIGVLIAAFIQSGTVAALMDYGLRVITPTFFLPATLLLCSVVSLAVGTSWGTVGTVGIVLLGIGDAMGIPLPLVAGAVVSGACFGDKMSPVSDTTNLAAMVSQVNLHRHINSMMYTTIPSYLIALIAFYRLGAPYQYHSLPDEKLHALHQGLQQTYHLHWLCLVPLIMMLILGRKKISAEITMISASAAAVLLAITLQHAPFSVVLNALYEGGHEHTGMASLDHLLSRGGIVAMLPTLSLSLMALALGGILNHFGFLKVLLAGVIARVKRRATLVITTLMACFVGNMSMGEAYMSIILGGQLFWEAYAQRGIDPAVLSRSLEEGATLTTALIPWATGGAFFASVLGVSVLDYAPWALFNWVNPLLSMLFAALGIALFQKDSNHSPIAKP